MNLIIGIAGKKGAGKDTVCEMIRGRFPKSERIAFADALKDEVCRAMLVTREYIEEHKTNFRLILQGWGTDYRRQLHGDDYWLRQWLMRVNRQDEDVVIVTPDVRFINEVLLIKKYGGYVFQVIRPTSTDDTHASETELDTFPRFDGYISNNRTLPILGREVETVLGMAGVFNRNKQKTTTNDNTNNSTNNSTKPNDSTAARG